MSSGAALAAAAAYRGVDLGRQRNLYLVLEAVHPAALHGDIGEGG